MPKIPDIIAAVLPFAANITLAEFNTVLATVSGVLGIVYLACKIWRITRPQK